MRTRKLGSKGPEISVVGMGTWEAGGMWGPNPADDEMIAAMRAGFDAGMNWVDTAEIYGPHTSEELVGRAVKGRDDVLVFTKLAPAPLGTGFDAKGVRAGAEASLGRIGRDAIDLYQLHMPPFDNTPIEETWEAMARLVDDGLVRFIGVSNFDETAIEKCEKIRHVDTVQPNFSMLFRMFGELIAWCGKRGIGVIGYGPLAFGLLTGTVTADTTFDQSDWRSGISDIPPLVALSHALFAPDTRPANLAKVEALRPIADRLGITQAQLAIAWAFHQDGVTGAICGTRSAGRARENAGAGDVELAPKDLEEIESILS